jgi:hypothetical protein
MLGSRSGAIGDISCGRESYAAHRQYSADVSPDHYLRPSSWMCRRCVYDPLRVFPFCNHPSSTNSASFGSFSSVSLRCKWAVNVFAGARELLVNFQKP